MELRKIKRIISANKETMGEHPMYQPLPNHEFSSIDPFLLVHHHGPHTFAPYNQGLPFGPHPHRGFETLTFIYKGAVEHADSQGFKSVIKPGGVQWMTAGRGIVHSENMPANMREEGGELEIIQLWINLPASLKKTSPGYQGLQNEQIPEIKSVDGLVSTKLISGSFKNQEGTAKSMTNLTMMNVSALAKGKETYEIAEEENVLFYLLNGELKVNDRLVIGHQLIEFDNSGNKIKIEAQTDCQFILGSGKPLNEPVVAQGPFVMNTTTEIMQAMRDYQMGKMGVM